MRELKFAVRYLVQNAGTTSVAILSLALGMMATTAMYSVLHAVVLDPFPYEDVDRLTSVRVAGAGQTGGRMSYSVDQFLEISERTAIFEGVIASTISDVLWTNGAEPQRVRGNHGTFNTFQVMGVPPFLGRGFTPADNTPGAPAVVVLGYRFWQRQFAGLKPGVTEERAASDLRPIIEDLKRREPGEFPDNWFVGLRSFKETFPSSIRQNLWTLFGAVGLLLLIACANVSNLLLSTAGARQKEMTVRAALGASRTRIVRQLLLESLLMAGIAAILGVFLAAGALQAILTFVPPGTIPDESDVRLNWPVLLFTLLVSVATSVLFGLAPALHIASRNLASPLRAAGRSLVGGRFQAILRKTLVVVEVALSLMLLVAAGLMIRTFLAMNHVDLGFSTERVLTMRVPLPERRYVDRDGRVAFFQELLPRVSAVPGVEAVGLNTGAHPFGNLTTPVEVPGASQVSPSPAVIHQTNAGYPHAFGIAVSQGHFFSDSDVQARSLVAVVNQAFVRTRLDDRMPIGQTIRIPRLAQPPFDLPDVQFQAVGVVGDTLNRGISDELLPEVYVPFTLAGRADRLVVLARQDPQSILKATVAQIYAIDKEQPAMEVRTIDNALQDFAYAAPRFNLVLFSLFAGLGLVLSVVGVYGVMSSAVAQQAREVGVRMAVGASPGNVFRMIVGRGAWLLTLGIALGLFGSVLSARLLSQYLWNVSAIDPLTLAGVSALLMLAGVQACLWPARRAARINPVITLRQE